MVSLVQAGQWNPEMVMVWVEFDIFLGCYYFAVEHAHTASDVVLAWGGCEIVGEFGTFFDPLYLVI